MATRSSISNTINKTREAASKDEVKKANRPNVSDMPSPEEQRSQSRPRTASTWSRIAGYAKTAGQKTREAARKVQTRSAKLDAQRAADRTEHVMTEVSATVTGLTKTLVSGTVGTIKGSISGAAKGTRPMYVKTLQAADNIALAGTWTKFHEAKGRHNQPIHYFEVDVEDEVQERYGVDTTIDVTDGVETHMYLDGERVDIIARPIYDEKTQELVGIFAFTLDDQQEVLVYDDAFTQ